MKTSYDSDVVAWANEQAALLRAGRLDEIDVFNIAEEIEGVAKSERRELGSALVILIGHLLKWKFQPDRRGRSWRSTIKEQRAVIRHSLQVMPGLKHYLDDDGWIELLWTRAALLAERETNLDIPENWRWPSGLVFDDTFWPD